MQFSKNLRKYRENIGYSAKELAELIGIKYTTYLNYENMGSEPKYEILCKLANALNVSTDELIGIENINDKLKGVDATETAIALFKAGGYSLDVKDNTYSLNIPYRLIDITEGDKNSYGDCVTYPLTLSEKELVLIAKYAVQAADKEFYAKRKEMLHNAFEKIMLPVIFSIRAKKHPKDTKE